MLVCVCLYLCASACVLVCMQMNTRKRSRVCIILFLQYEIITVVVLSKFLTLFVDALTGSVYAGALLRVPPGENYRESWDTPPRDLSQRAFTQDNSRYYSAAVEPLFLSSDLVTTHRRADCATNFDFCDSSVREKDRRCRKRGMQAT